MRKKVDNLLGKRDVIMIKEERFAHDSDLGVVREILRPLLKNGFQGLGLRKPKEESEIMNSISKSVLARTCYILGGQLIYRENIDWLVNGKTEVQLESTRIKESAWIIVLIYVLIINRFLVDLVVEKPYLGLNENQQKMLNELLVLYEGIGGRIYINGDGSCHFNMNQLENIELMVK